MTRQCTPLYTALAVMLAPWSFSVCAGETPLPESSLEEVVVSGSRTSTLLSETPAAIGIVHAEELNRDKPKSVGDIINRVPGVYWNDLGNEQHSMGIRQPFNTNSVYQYLEDGIPIRPLGVFNHNALNEMNMADADSVEVVKGAASSLYGSNAVGGAVNFITARPSRTPYASVGVRSDNTNGYTRYDTAASNTWGDFGLRFSQYSAHRNRDNWQEYSNASKDSYSLHGEYALSPSSVLRASLVHTNLDTATSGSVFENDYRDNPGKSLNSFTYRKDKATRANIAWEGETIPNGITTVTLFSRKNDHSQIPNYTISLCKTGTCAGQWVGTSNSNRVDSIGLDAKHQQEFEWLRARLVTGIYIDKSDNPYVSDNLRVVRDPVSGKYLSYTPANAIDPKGVRNYQADIDNNAVFAQFEISPTDRLRLVMGGRYDSIRYGYTNNLTPGGSSDFGAPNEDRSFSSFSPKVGATYAITKQTSVYSNISKGFTPPEVSQLYGKTGIPDLKPATYNNYELGLRMAFLDGALKLDSALYRLDGTNTIVNYTIEPGDSENRNAGRTRSQGIELGLNWEQGAFDGRFGTTIAKHRFLEYRASSSLDYSGREMPQAPSDITTAEIGYKPMQNMRVALEVVHQGKYWMNGANTVRYPGHTLLNLRGYYELARGWQAWTQIRNIADRHYAYNASTSNDLQNSYTPGEPRSVMIGLTYTFDGK